MAEVAPIPPDVAPVAGLVNTPNLVEGDTISESLDELVNLIAHLQANLAVPSHILVDPYGWTELRKLKVGDSA